MSTAGRAASSSSCVVTHQSIRLTTAALLLLLLPPRSAHYTPRADPLAHPCDPRHSLFSQIQIYWRCSPRAKITKAKLTILQHSTCTYISPQNKCIAFRRAAEPGQNCTLTASVAVLLFGRYQCSIIYMYSMSHYRRNRLSSTFRLFVAIIS